MKLLLFIIYFVIFVSSAFCETALMSAVVGMSAVASTDQLLKNKDKGLLSWLDGAADFLLEEVMLVTDESTNNSGALKVHLVVVYNTEIYDELKKSTSHEYFNHIEQLVKDHPNEIKIFEWQMAAKKTLSPWIPLEYPNDNMKPLGGFVFANYSGGGENRALIPKDHKKIKIELLKDDLKIIPKDEEE